MLSRMGGSLNLRRLKFKAVREYYTTVKESFRSTDLHFFALMDAAIIEYEHQQLVRKILMELMQKGNEGPSITLGRLLPINPLTLKV